MINKEKKTVGRKRGRASISNNIRELITTELAFRMLSILSDKEFLPNAERASLNKTLDKLIIKVHFLLSTSTWGILVVTNPKVENILIIGRSCGGIKGRMAIPDDVTTKSLSDYEIDSIKAELENKVFLMLIRRTIARRQGQRYAELLENDKEISDEGTSETDPRIDYPNP